MLRFILYFIIQQLIILRHFSLTIKRIAEPRPKGLGRLFPYSCGTDFIDKAILLRTVSTVNTFTCTC